jgi:GNAT superfamily N-acetyltransferase
VSETQEPDVVQVRRAASGDADAIARVKVDTWHTTYRGMVPDRYLKRMSYAAHAEDWSRIAGDPANFVYVAEDRAGQAVGFVAGGPRRDGPERYTAELYALYIRAEHQGRRVGTQLVETIVTALERAGFGSMLLWVLTENRRARAIYEKLGGVAVASQKFEIDGVPIGEVAYGWERTSTVLDRLCTRDRAAGNRARPAQMVTSPSSSSSRSGS